MFPGSGPAPHCSLSHCCLLFGTFLVVHFLLHIPCCIYPVVYFLMPPGTLLICHQDGHNYLFKRSHSTCFFPFHSGHNLAMSLFVQVKVLVTQSCLTLKPHGLNAEVGSYSLLQGIFLTQGSSTDLLHFRWSLYHLSHLINSHY